LYFIEEYRETIQTFFV